MKFIVATICCFLIVTCAEGNPQRKIFLGRNAREGQFPYQVSLQGGRFEGHFCGGSILTSKFVLTACHCFYNESREIMEWTASATKIFVGSIYKNNTSHGVKKLKCHEEYSPFGTLNDIALLEVETEIQFTTNVKAIKLPTSNIADNEILTASGWGLSYNEGTRQHPKNEINPDNLQFLKLSKKNLEECKNMAGRRHVTVTAGMLCATSDDPYSKAICMGDSGGPLVAHGIQYGIVSKGVGECASGGPEIFTDVFSYIDWINGKMFVDYYDMID